MWASEIKLRAWRRMGEISRGLVKKAGRPPENSPDGRENSKAEVLEQAGITTQDASRAEHVAVD